MSLRDRYEKAREQNAAKYAAAKSANEQHGRPSNAGWGCLIAIVVVVVVYILLVAIFGK